MPIIFLLGLLILIVVVPHFSGVSIFSGFNFEGISSGVTLILPLLGIGLGIGMILLIFAVIRRQTR